MNLATVSICLGTIIMLSLVISFQVQKVEIDDKNKVLIPINATVLHQQDLTVYVQPDNPHLPYGILEGNYTAGTRLDILYNQCFYQIINRTCDMNEETYLRWERYDKPSILHIIIIGSLILTIDVIIVIYFGFQIWRRPKLDTLLI